MSFELKHWLVKIEHTIQTKYHTKTDINNLNIVHAIM